MTNGSPFCVCMDIIAKLHHQGGRAADEAQNIHVSNRNVNNSTTLQSDPTISNLSISVHILHLIIKKKRVQNVSYTPSIRQCVHAMK